MTDPRQTHLDADDLDALLSRSESETVRAHLSHCLACQELAQSDRALVRALEALPQFAPSAAFVDQVMSRVTVRRAPARSIWKLSALSRWQPRTIRRAAVVAVTLLAAMSASVVWTLGNRDQLSAWGSQVVALLDGWLWLGLRTMAANVTAQPWFDVARDLLGSPARLAIAAGLGFVAYIAGVVALRRLVALPSSRPMPHGNW